MKLKSSIERAGTPENREFTNRYMRRSHAKRSRVAAVMALEHACKRRVRSLVVRVGALCVGANLQQSKAASQARSSSSRPRPRAARGRCRSAYRLRGLVHPPGALITTATGPKASPHGSYGRRSYITLSDKSTEWSKPWRGRRPLESEGGGDDASRGGDDASREASNADRGAVDEKRGPKREPWRGRRPFESEGGGDDASRSEQDATR